MLTWLRQLFCIHRFAYEDLEKTGIKPPDRPSGGTALGNHDAWTKYWDEYYHGDHLERRVRWPCDKCGKVFYANAGYTIIRDNNVFWRKNE